MLRGFAKMLFRREIGFWIGIGGNITSGRGGKFFANGSFGED